MYHMHSVLMCGVQVLGCVNGEFVSGDGVTAKGVSKADGNSNRCARTSSSSSPS